MSYRPSSPTLRGTFDGSFSGSFHHQPQQQRNNLSATTTSSSSTSTYYPQNGAWVPMVDREGGTDTGFPTALKARGVERADLKDVGFFRSECEPEDEEERGGGCRRSDTVSDSQTLRLARAQKKGVPRRCYLGASLIKRHMNRPPSM